MKAIYLTKNWIKLSCVKLEVWVKFIEFPIWTKLGKNELNAACTYLFWDAEPSSNKMFGKISRMMKLQIQ